MATKSKENKYNFPELKYHLDQFPGCCGICVANYFHDEEGEYSWGTGRYQKVKNKYDTRKQQAKACLEHLKEHIKNSDYTYCQIAMVSKYHPKYSIGGPDIQYPELQEELIADNWTIHNVFINPNHGNEVTVFSKHFPEWYDEMRKAALEENGIDVEDEEELTNYF